MNTISLIIHVTAAVLLVGPQIILFLAVTPATWLIDDERLRSDVTRVVGARFGMIAGASLIALLVTGLYQFFSLVPDVITDDMSAYRWGPIFMVKMTLFVGIVVLIAAHTIYFAPRIRRLSERVAQGEGDDVYFELEQKRRASFVLTFFLMLVSLAVLFLGVALGHREYSYVPF